MARSELPPPLPPETRTVGQLVAEAIPLRVVQHGAHVDEHHQLALEEPRTRVIQSGGNATDGGAVELEALQCGGGKYTLAPCTAF